LGAWIALGLLIAAGLILLLKHDSGTIAGLDPSHFAGVMASLALLIYLGGSLLRGYRHSIISAFKDIVIWAAFALILIAIYSYRVELLSVAHRVAGELMPAGTEIVQPTGPDGMQSVKLRRGSDGHFVTRAMVNGDPVSFIVDTGASSVVLRQEDALRIGVDTRQLRYAIPVQTANGTSYAARIRLKSIQIGKITAKNVEALIARPGMLHQSLLGMSFLSRLRSYEFEGDYLTLRI